MKKIILIVLLLLAIGFAVKTSWMYSKNAKSGTPVSATVTTQVSLTKNLTFGDYDPEVGIVQNFLVNNGYLERDTYVVNSFGTTTENAVKHFQVNHGIAPADGSVNSVTRALLNSFLAPPVTSLTQNLNVGDTGPEVSALQTFLMNTGYLPWGTYTIFGATTKAAVASFQVNVGISPADGFVGPSTRVVINGLLARPTIVPPTKLTLYLSKNRNALSTEVALLQKFLKDNSFLDKDEGAYVIYDTAVEKAVLNFQTAKGIQPANGEVGTSTRNVINAMIGKPTPEVQSFEAAQSTSKPNTYQVSYSLINTTASSSVTVGVSCESGLTVQRMDDGGNLRPYACGDLDARGVNGYLPYNQGSFVLVFTNSTSKNITANVVLSARDMNSQARTVTITPKGTVVNPPQPEPSCKDVKSSGFKLDPSSYAVTMIDKKGDKDFNVSLIPNNSCVKYKYTVDATGDLASAIKGTTAGSATGKTTIKKTLSDSKLSVVNPRLGSTTYKGQLKVTIVSTTNSADKVTLTQNITVTVKMK